jgi:hypothetical protein
VWIWVTCMGFLLMAFTGGFAIGWELSRRRCIRTWLEMRSKPKPKPARIYSYYCTASPAWPDNHLAQPGAFLVCGSSRLTTLDLSHADALSGPRDAGGGLPLALDGRPVRCGVCGAPVYRALTALVDGDGEVATVH